MEVIKNSMYNTEDMKGKLIISSPSIFDNRFYKSVILITNQDDKGITGLVINKLSAHKFNHIIKNLDSSYNETNINTGEQKIDVVLGGPVNNNNLFILHSNDYTSENTIKINDHLYITNKPNILFDIAHNKGPKNSIISIGCSIWRTGQLEAELFANTWFVYDFDESIIFKTTHNKMYDRIFQLTGFKDFEDNPAFFVQQSIKL